MLPLFRLLLIVLVQIMYKIQKKNFIKILKNSAVKTIKTTAEVIIIIIEKITVMQSALNCQVTSRNKINTKKCKTLPISLRYLENCFYLLLKK